VLLVVFTADVLYKIMHRKLLTATGKGENESKRGTGRNKCGRKDRRLGLDLREGCQQESYVRENSGRQGDT
jgi:hypothetical protein